MAIITNYLLFNHTYLRKLQADSSVDERASFVAQGVRDWHSFRDHASIESLVSSWIQPVLNSLELDLQSSDQGNSHVYLLYKISDWSEPVGLCYITPPGADLDTTIKGRHWMAQAVLAARRWEPATESSGESEAEDGEKQALRWVILTNGHQWRLLDAQALRRYEAYLQVDLEELVRDPGDLSALRVFYRCFHRSAFEQNAGGRSGLDRLLNESNHATKKAEDHLKACVSANEGVMAHLCLGLVEATGKDHFTEEERDAIYQDATYLLYRLLFILYAEARNLLPMDNPSYQQASLATLVETAHTFRLQGIPDPQAKTLWLRLKRLCNAIYESDPELGIPAYNGGLFDDGDKPHLRMGTIADGHLTQALFDLAYQSDGNENDGYRRIDYRDLSVRHLGSIYEGMIEYKLQIAEDTLWARRDAKGNVRFLSTGQDEAPRRNDVEIEQGGVYFSQSPGERRATGTYYTPEYVVDYIVRLTVKRGLLERRAHLEETVADWLKELAATIDSGERSRMQRTADEELLRFIETKVLTFRVCDPAMGSGHFLVNACYQITNFAIETLHLIPWGDGMSTVDTNPVIWRRQVVEQCLYGVDISLMAVELTKLSLWLASVAKGKPLNFLKHHLRQGNSLIGARLEELSELVAGMTPAGPSRREQKARAAGQLSMLDDPAFSQHVATAKDLLAQIASRVAETVEDVKAQESDFERMLDELEPYRQLANLLVARDFGVEVHDKRLLELARYIVESSGVRVPEYDSIQVGADQEATSRQFLHWALEYPAALLAGDGKLQLSSIGFDACVGNPPWGADLDVLEREFLKSTYSHIHKRTPESSNYFIGQGLDILADGGYLGFIVPNNLLYQHEFIETRRVLLGHFFIDTVLNLGDGVFEQATMPSCVVVVGKQLGANPEDHSFAIADLRSANKARLNSLTLLESPMTQVRQKAIMELPGLVFQSDQVSSSLLNKVYLGSQKLGDLAKEVAAGIGTGGDKIFRLSAEQARELHFESSNLKPVLIGREIDSYYVPEDSEHVLIYATKHFAPEQNPSIMRYLGPFEEKLSRKRETRKGLIPWYSLHWPRYPQLFDPPKIVCRQTSDTLIAALDERGYYVLNSILVVKLKDSCPLSLEYVLALLNSKLLRHVYASLTQEKARAFAEVKPVNLRKIPIRSIGFISPIAERARHATMLQESLNTYFVSRDRTPILKFVEQLLDQMPPKSDSVHDLLAHLTRQMIDLSAHHHRLSGEADLFRLVDRGTACARLNKVLGLGEMVTDLSTVRHDIEALHLTQEADNKWLLSVQAKLRDPGSDWQEHQRDQDGNFVREWLPVYRLALDKATGRFYHYAFASLDGFDGAGKFPGGYTRTTLEKLKATKVPKFVPVDLAPLAALETELAEVRRKIQLTDDLIDQIVYRLYGLTEEEIAIVEGKA